MAVRSALKAMAVEPGMVAGGGDGVGVATIAAGSVAVIATVALRRAAPTELLAVRANAYSPAIVGVPENSPVTASKARPGGSAPVTPSRIGRVPVAVMRYAYATPTFLSGGAHEVIAGARAGLPWAVMTGARSLGSAATGDGLVGSA